MKKSNSSTLAGFSYWLHDRHARSRDQTGYKYQRSATNFISSLPLFCLITQGETLLPLTSNFSSLFTLPILLFFWSEQKYSKTIPNCVLAKFQPHFLQNILRQLQIVS